jgi:hypothetical protein
MCVAASGRALGESGPAQHGHRRRRGPSSRRSVLRRCQRDGQALGYFSTSTVSFLKIVAPRLTKYLLSLRSAGERLALL